TTPQKAAKQVRLLRGIEHGMIPRKTPPPKKQRRPLFTSTPGMKILEKSMKKAGKVVVILCALLLPQLAKAQGEVGLFHKDRIATAAGISHDWYTGDPQPS